MSLEVNKIIKKYGDQIVLNEVGFKANPGEILGFLGPNGAGKTTTMKIITGYTKADSGEVKVCDFDVESQSKESKTKIGYLPENNPLYASMYVKEYLAFVARIHRIANSRSRIEEMIQNTGLSKEKNKKISMLSKGYKQRVGLAQALLHDPEVLILDEPTSGLDPNQLEDIRHLIKSLGKEKTVVFSSHIMQEVQALCDRVIIINNGNIVADDKIDQLEKYISTGKERILIEFENPVDRTLFDKLPGLIQLHPLEGNNYIIDCESEMEMRRAIFRLSKTKDLPLIGLQKQDITVENVFQALTK